MRRIWGLELLQLYCPEKSGSTVAKSSLNKQRQRFHTTFSDTWREFYRERSDRSQRVAGNSRYNCIAFRPSLRIRRTGILDPRGQNKQTGHAPNHGDDKGIVLLTRPDRTDARVTLFPDLRTATGQAEQTGESAEKQGGAAGFGNGLADGTRGGFDVEVPRLFRI